VPSGTSVVDGISSVSVSLDLLETRAIVSMIRLLLAFNSVIDTVKICPYSLDSRGPEQSLAPISKLHQFALRLWLVPLSLERSDVDLIVPGNRSISCTEKGVFAASMVPEEMGIIPPRGYETC
jgi:hypothetical protein